MIVNASDWDKFVSEDRVNDVLESGEMTVQMYVKLTGLKTSQAGRKLKERFASGLLTRRKFGVGYAYRLARTE